MTELDKLSIALNEFIKIVWDELAKVFVPLLDWINDRTSR